MIRPKTKISENPFYQMKDTLELYEYFSKASKEVNGTQVFLLLTRAWSECKDSLEKRQLFFSIVFSIFDITNREHNIFRKKGIKNVDNGGYAKRNYFQTVVNWMEKNTPNQLYAFLPILGEYYNNGGVILYQNKTDRKKGNLISTQKVSLDVDKVVDYIHSVLSNTKTSENDLSLWAKWLPKIPSSSRKRVYILDNKTLNVFNRRNPGKDYKLGDRVVVNKAKKSFTVQKDEFNTDLIYKLSVKMGWKIVKNDHYVDFLGYRKFRSAYLEKTEAHQFSSKKVFEMDKTQFINWINSLPSSARYRVQCRIVNKDASGKLASNKKWVNKKYDFDLGEVFLEWMEMKKESQKKLNSLTKEEREKLSPKEIKQMEKAAKVNVGASNLLEETLDFLTGQFTMDEVNIKAHSILEKVKLEVPVLIVADTSGSMSSSALQHKGRAVSAHNICSFLSTVFLLKNPIEEDKSMLIRFNTYSQVVMDGTTFEEKTSRFSTVSKKVVVKSLADRKQPFTTNFEQVHKILYPNGGTNIEGVARMFKEWVDSEPAYKQQRIEAINEYPVFLFISDNAFNSSETPVKSLQEFQRNMMHWFGWNGVCVLWDVDNTSTTEKGSKKFHGTPNTVYLGGYNIGILNQVFKNIHDLDIIDFFITLKSMYLSNRYQPVRELVF